MLAVKIDYESARATIGTERGRTVPRDEILAALKSIGYGGTFVEP